MQPKRGRPKTLDAEKTLQVAMQAYWQRDPADVSVNEICKLAGVSKPALYREFGSEDGLTLAVLDRYAEEVLSDIFAILGRSAPLAETLEALTAFAAQDPKMETGCVFYKMRAGKHRLGPKTLAQVDALQEGAVAAFAGYLEGQRAAGNWSGTAPAEIAGRYLFEQIGLALTQRASGEERAQVAATLTLAFSVLV